MTRTAADPPLDGDELIGTLRRRWKASYDLQLVRRRRRLYLQVMWGYLEQQSFPLSESEYRVHIQQVAEALNRMGVAGSVRRWLETSPDRPRLGKAMSLALDGDGAGDARLDEFLV
ncbi:DUF3067 family protein [Synechococcus sp. RSCCF101]|uniref:DUF3067 family protein n=1 Tax=Synechococcus sp. RSCCF101 TaxID=2511069 RepID=UPI001247BB45|nr:DUF3067 family protein [Synechococcus sp. RSCCF101]QEY30963.1 DUF3067 family protein [Synechococcus sp. RSCCF101]